MSGIFNAQRAAYCGLILAGVPAYQAATIVRSSHKTLEKYLSEDWFSGPRFRATTQAVTSERHQAIVDHFCSGHRTMKETGDAFGITRERVRQILVMHGIDVRTYGATPRAVKEAALSAYRQAISEGLRASEAAEASGHSDATLRFWASELGQKLPRPRSRRRERWPEIARFYQEHTDLRQHQVAAHFGVARQEVSRALSAMGIPSRWWRSPETAARRHASRKARAAQPTQDTVRA